MKIAIGCDHAGVELKNKILPVLKELSIICEDEGTYEELSVDYPDFGEKVAEMVSKGEVRGAYLYAAQASACLLLPINFRECGQLCVMKNIPPK